MALSSSIGSTATCTAASTLLRYGHETRPSTCTRSVSELRPDPCLFSLEVSHGDIHSRFEYAGAAADGGAVDGGARKRRRRRPAGRLIVALYIDDWVYTGSSTELTDWFESELYDRYGNCKPQDCDFILGTNVHRGGDGSYGLHHGLYISTMAKELNLSEAKAPSTPLPPGTVIDPVDSAAPGAPISQPYRRVLAQCTWLVTTCRPDIAQAVCQLGRVQCNPGKAHCVKQQAGF